MQSTTSFLVALVLAGAVSVGSTASGADPEEAQYNVVVTLYNAGQWEAALKKITQREAQELSDPMRAKYMYARGLAMEKGEKKDDAASAYDALLKKYPDAPESMKARVALVYIRYSARDYDAVLAAIQQIKPNSISAAEQQQFAIMAGEVWSAKKETKKALEAYQQALKLGADRVSLQPKLFNIYYQLRMYGELIDLSADGIPGVPGDTVAAIRAEALLEAGKLPQAEAEARKVPVGSENLPRASFTLAQALIKQGKLADAVGPLQTAIENLKEPPVPPSAYLALAECLLAAGQTNSAGTAVEAAVAKGNSIADAEAKASFRAGAALLNIRIASAMGDHKKLAAAVTEARPSIEAERLPELLYARLFALHALGDDAEVIRAMQADRAVFRGTKQEGKAVLLCTSSLKRAKKNEEAVALLDEFINRETNTVEALRARVDLANMALAREDYPRSVAMLGVVLGVADSAAKLGSETFAECRYNYALAAAKTGDLAGAINALESLCKDKPAPELGGAACLLLGQSYSQSDQHPKAAAAWRQAIAFGGGVDVADTRDRIARSLLAAGDSAGARSEYETLASEVGGADKMSREAYETWARALYATGDHAGAAAAYQALHTRFKAAGYAYESAVCLEKAKQWTEAETWYVLAEKAQAELPAEYAKNLTENLNRVRFQAGTGDLGLAYWLDRLESKRSHAEFEAAVSALSRITYLVKPDTKDQAKLEAAQGEYQPDSIRYFSVGALRLHSMAVAEQAEALRLLGTLLAEALTAHEGSFTVKSWGTTVGTAMIYYYQAEGERRAGNHAEALGTFETVLAVYPYNEWPDAAACGAAECYVALGDIPTALTKLNEVVKTADAANAASATWVKQAEKRIKELTEGK